MTPASLRAEDLSIVIPTQNRWDVLGRTIEGLRRQTVSGFETIVVVDEGAEVPSHLRDAEYVLRDQPGVAAARNSGVRHSSRALVLFLGDDTIPTPRLVERHLARHAEHPQPEVGILGHVAWHPAVARGRLQRWLDWSDTQFDFRHIVSDEAGWGRLYTSNVSLKRDMFWDVGGFDEDFTFGYEDLDLGYRLHDKGFRLLYDPDALVEHYHRYDWRGIQRRFVLMGGGEHLMVQKHPEFPPHFLDVLSNRRRTTALSLWPLLVDRIPTRAARWRHTAERRAGAWYGKALTPSFVAGWSAAAELAERSRFEESSDQPPATDRPFDQLTTGAALAHRLLAEALRRPPGHRRILQFRGATGSPGLELLRAGFDVEFVADGGRAADFLRWRIAERGLHAPVHDDDAPLPSGFDVAIACIGPEPGVGLGADLASVDGHAALVAVAVAGGPALARVLGHAGGRLVRFRSLPEGGALVVYRTGRPGRGGRLRALVERAVGRVVPPRSAPVAASIG